jgi:hypothetical protein
MPRKNSWTLLVIANVLVYCVLSFYQTGAAQSGPRPTLANPVQERMEMIANLQDIKALLKEQNALLRSGQVKVIVTEMPRK